MIPFSPPRIDEITIDAVREVLESGWITTGPKTKQFEKEITAYCQVKSTVAVNSWTAGMQVLLNWWGIGEGDEVIVPAYTYCASVNVIVHSGAKPVLVDVAPGEFNINVQQIRGLINERTKAIIGVDIGGVPADYDSIMQLVNEQRSKDVFVPNSMLQDKLNRILVLADAAHSFGATVNGKPSATLADISTYSFHAVKNLTTAEGGAICFNLPNNFNHDEIYRDFCTRILHGQSKDALAKTQKGNWRYDVEEPGFKCNMTDIQAAIGLVELSRYEENLNRREEIFSRYNSAFSENTWAIIPVSKEEGMVSSFHLYQLRVNGASEAQRDMIIQEIAENDVAVNVHFQPIPLLTAYKKRGYKMEDYPETFKMYENEISLPVYFNLTNDQVDEVVRVVRKAVQKIIP